jgi:phosphinothricin acetyltransferase
LTIETSVYVRVDGHRRGIGLALLRALLAACEARGYRQAVAVIGDSGNLASIRLHERAGFHRVGLLEAVGWKHGRWLDVVQMQRPLGPGQGAPAQLIR